MRKKTWGVVINKELNFSKQCTEAVKKANRALGFIYRSFEFKSKRIIMPLYKSLVRPHLEYAVQFRSPYLRKDIIKIEGVQRRATKMIPELRGKPYPQRLQELDIHSLETRRLRGRLIATFKILNKFENIYYEIFFNMITTKCHVVMVKYFAKLCKKNFFTFDVINK